MYRGYYNQNNKWNFSLFIIFDRKRANICVVRRVIKDFFPFVAPWFTARDSLCTSRRDFALLYRYKGEGFCPVSSQRKLMWQVNVFPILSPHTVSHTIFYLGCPHSFFLHLAEKRRHKPLLAVTRVSRFFEAEISL